MTPSTPSVPAPATTTAVGIDKVGAPIGDSVSMKKEAVPVKAAVSEEKKMMCSILNGPDCEACQ